MKRALLFLPTIVSMMAISSAQSQTVELQVESLRVSVRNLDAILRNPNPAYFPDSVYFAGARIPTENPMVRRKLMEAIRFYVGSTRDRERFGSYLIEMRYYGRYWDSVFSAAGLSTDYTSIPIVESAMNPRARSRAGAVGFWQLMRGTGRGCGLRIDARVDERRNLERSARCAIAHLLRSDSIFGDPILNLAAYNKGNSGVREALRMSGANSFYEAVFVKRDGAFVTETMNYPYRVIAANLVRRNPELYFVRNIPEDPPSFNLVIYEARRATTIIEIARFFGVSAGIFLDKNPQFETNRVPPGRYIIAVPRVAAPQE